MNCVKSGCCQFSLHWNYNGCEFIRPHSKAKRIVVGEMQLINSDSALHQMPLRDHKTRRTIAESLSYMPMLLPTLLATAGPVWDLGLLPSDSLRDPSSVQSKSLSQVVPQRTNRPSDGANEHLSMSNANEKNTKIQI